MKYSDPEIKITEFSKENIVTASVTFSTNTESGYVDENGDVLQTSAQYIIQWQ